MALITLQILDGADRGRMFQNIPTPITIGREEGNTIQLNDERISRYHLKIQEDQDKIVLTDLDSTNGTKVNGDEMQLRILRHGDLISLGRSVLLFGSREQIAERLSKIPRSELSESGTAASELPSAVSLEYEVNPEADGDEMATFHDMEPPDLPEQLTPGQAAQLTEILDFVFFKIRRLVNSVESDEKNGAVTLDLRRWQALLDLQSRLAEYRRSIANPPIE